MLALFAISLGCLSFLASVEAGPFKNHQKINIYLINNVQTDDVHQNLAAAERMLENEIKKGFYSNKGLIEDLNRFIGLRNLFNDNKECNRTSFSTILDNHDATKGAAHSDEAPLKRLDKIVYKCFKYHAVQCRDVYPGRYVSLYTRLVKEKVEKIRFLTDRVFTSTTIDQDQLSLTMSQRLWEKYIETPPTFDTKKKVLLLYNSLALMAKNDPDKKFLGRVVNERIGKRYVDKLGLERLFDKYVVDPCVHYLAVLGPDLFYPATFDDSHDHYTDDKKQYYYFAWSRFRICETLVHREQTRLIDEFASLAVEA